MDDFDSLAEFICFIIFMLLIYAIFLQVDWLVKKEIYGTTDCFWKECVVVKEGE